ASTLVNMLPALQCYCTPATTSSTYYINNVVTTGAAMDLNNTSSGYSPGGYGDYTGTDTLRVIENGAFDFNITFGSSASYTFGVKIWVDWNMNGNFNDPGEVVYASSAYSSVHAGTLDLSLVNPPVGQYRVRIGANYNNAAGPSNACESFANGEYEDYILDVVALTPCTGTPNPGVAAITSNDQLCVSGDVELQLTGYTAINSGITIQWEDGDEFGNWTPIVGATDPQYTDMSVGYTKIYRAAVTCTDMGGNTYTGYSNEDTVWVENPQLLSTMGGSRCGDGTVDLQATADAGYVVNWYDVPTGGSPIATGNVFTTPVISTTTDFYVSASTGGSGSIYVGPVDPASVGTSSGTTAPITTYHMAFDVLVPTTIVSIDVYPTASVGSTGGIEIRDNADNIIANIPYV